MVLVVWDLVWKGLVGGVVGFVTRRVMEVSEKELEKLQALPPSQARRDKEEILADYIDEVFETIGDADEITIRKGVKVIRSRAGVFAAYLHLKIQRLTPVNNNSESNSTPSAPTAPTVPTPKKSADTQSDLHSNYEG